MVEDRPVEAQDFQSELGTTFLVELPDEKGLVLELTKVDLLTPSGLGERTQPFALVFTSAPDAPALSQGTFLLVHERLGGLGIFVVPIGPDPDTSGMRYEAIFS